MQIRRHVDILRRRKWLIALTLATTLAVVALGSSLMAPVYSASATVRIAVGSNSPIGYAELNYAGRLMTTYVQLMKSRPFTDRVIQQLDLHVQPEDLSKSIEVEAIPNSELIRITAESANPVEAVGIANALAGLLVEQGKSLYFGQSKSPAQILKDQLDATQESLAQDRQALARLSQRQADPFQSAANQDLATRIEDLAARIRLQEGAYALLLSDYNRAQAEEARQAGSVTIAEPAAPPRFPGRPRPNLYLALGALLGLLGGVGLGFLVESMDTTIRSPRRLAVVAKVPLLGQIPTLRGSRKKAKDHVVLPGWSGQHSSGEVFRLLGAHLLSILSGPAPSNVRRPVTLLVTSAEPRAGKTTVVSNLAAAMVDFGLKVAVVDCSPSNPSLHRALGLVPPPGLADALEDPDRVDAVLRESGVEGVSVLSGGSRPEASPILLDSQKLRRLIERLAQKADVVLLDGPAALSSAAAAVLAPLADGVLLVANRDQSKEGDVEEALAHMHRVGARTLGVVLNRAESVPRFGQRGNRQDPETPSLDSRGRRLYLWTKWAMDVTLSALALALLSPLMLVLAASIKLDSPGPVIFAQERVGYDWRRRRHRTFTLYKFRSMVQDCDQGMHRQLIQDWIRGRKSSTEKGKLVKLSDDPRVTRVGRMLRRTSLDELPQLWNVLKGDMTLVGPRPVPLYEVAEYEPWHHRRLQATPGITCLWQVTGRGLSNIDEMVCLDVEYIERQSLLLDLQLLLRTIPVVLSGRGAA